MHRMPGARICSLVGWCGLVVCSIGLPPDVAAQTLHAQTTVEADSQPEASFRWQIEEGEAIALVDGEGTAIWQFVYGTDRTHAYFHPIGLPGGSPLTLDRPGDHVHHHGLWFCWKYINGVNFWEHAPGSDRPAGRTQWEVVKIVPGEDLSARIEMAVRYVMPGGEVALRESREIDISAPDPDGQFAIDWRGAFVAEAEEVVLDRTPLPGEPGGRIFGGYAGLSARLVQFEDRRAFTLEEAVEFNTDNRFRGRSNGFEYSGVVAGEDVGIAILSDPANLNAPSPWYAIRTGVMTFFTPAVICYGPHRLGRGEGVDLRYRIVVHPGQWGREELAQAFALFSGPLDADKLPEPDPEESNR